MFVSGKISTKAILECRKREIQTLYLLEGVRNKDIGYILSQAQDIPVVYTDRETLNELSNTESHGGVVLECGPRKMDDIAHLSRLLLVEGIRDPYQLGDILRTAFAMNLDGIISSSYDFHTQEALLIRASAGASEHLTWVTSDDMGMSVASLKSRGVRIFSAHRATGSVPLQKADLTGPVCVCIGGMMRGLSKEVLDQSDGFVKLDYTARIALSAVSTSSIISYELFRQMEE